MPKPMFLVALLAAMHAAGVAHGDFRGHNLIVARDSLYAVTSVVPGLRADSPANSGAAA